MISSLAVTQQQALLGAFLFLVPSIILSGFATPIANMPVWVQDPDLAQPDALFPGHPARRVPGRGERVVACLAVLADGGDRRRSTLAAAGWLFRKRVT